MIDSLQSFLLYPLALIVTLGVLITVHEFGHFWVARRMGVKVLRFSVGFGRPLWLRRGRDGTEYVIAAIPLGGYVRMLDEREGEVPVQDLERAFNRQHVARRTAIVAAGPAFNFLFAILAYSIMFMVGIPGTRPLLDAPAAGSAAEAGGFQQGDLIVAIAEQPTPTLNEVHLALLEQALDQQVITVEVKDEEDRRRRRTLDLRGVDAEDRELLANLGLNPWPIPAVVGQVLEDSPAQRAGLEPGDRIVAIAGEPVKNWPAMAEAIAARPGEPLMMAIERGARRLELEVTPEAVTTEQGTVGRIGVGGTVPEELAQRLQVVVRHGPLQAIGTGVVQTWDTSLLMLRMLWRMVTLRASLENLSGPLTIAHFAGKAASIGWLPFLYLLAAISISLGVLNLLPIPVLDGGHLLYYLIEAIKGSPPSDFAQEIGLRVGIVFLVMLMGLAFFNDLVRLLG